MKGLKVIVCCLSPKQTNHLGKISSDLLLWSPLHCLCESFDKQAQKQALEFSSCVIRVDSAAASARKTIPEPRRLQDWLVQTHPSTNSTDPTAWTSSHHPEAAADRVTLRSSFSVWAFSASSLRRRDPSPHPQTSQRGPAEPRAAPEALTARLARLGLRTPSATAGC